MMRPFLFFEIHHAVPPILCLFLLFLLPLGLQQLKLDVYSHVLLHILIIGSEVDRLSLFVSELNDLFRSIALSESSHAVVHEMLVWINLEVHYLFH